MGIDGDLAVKSRRRQFSVVNCGMPVEGSMLRTEVTMTADHARAIADYFAKMFDQEFVHTMKVLRAVPNDRRDYSRMKSLGRLGSWQHTSQARTSGF